MISSTNDLLFVFAISCANDYIEASVHSIHYKLCKLNQSIFVLTFGERVRWFILIQSRISI